MLSESSAAVVKATLPVVQAHGEAITGCFYPRMFKAHPELLNIFNRGNQANGAQKAALAASVVAYAEHLLGVSDLPWTPILERIAHKHVRHIVSDFECNCGFGILGFQLDIILCGCQ